VRLLEVEFTKAQLDRLPKEDRIFFVQLTHFLDELAILHKCLIVTTQTMSSAAGAEKMAQRVQAMFFVRMLAGKLNEGWDMLKNSYARTRPRNRRGHPPANELIPGKYYNHLHNEMKNLLAKLTGYFSQGSNLIYTIRNKYSFHYDNEEIAKR
jgi:hypothetical protein